ncbi:Eukaryotic_rRNA processing protein EBP2 [Hexamita inflata]|uniref:Eukaryotic rRNA processing protein EBP2 n=1 Tax=Hexamita inflata TaxID=28002 RepID=A0AA86PEE4_9EUKA|nr:Eukaryotic rRNA processing protein EBP2 [Hexamita inflata]CAI9934550.1 Eukaryotic rRNA processing protein EBP2 [Hexamita inflata]
MKEQLQLALASLINPDEHYIDYLSMVTKHKRPSDDADDADIDQYNIDLAKSCVTQAKINLIAEDIPFRKPTDFTPQMFRSNNIEQRVERIQEKKSQELQMQQQIRKRRLERQQQIALQHGKRMGKHTQIRMQKEIIEKWKAERAQLQKNGVDESKLPSLEDIEAKYAKEKKTNRSQKNAKFGGKHTKAKAKRQLSRDKRREDRK